jgi:stearoyl-CoA 9-desaturase NADPH oxidoreductase
MLSTTAPAPTVAERLTQPLVRLLRRSLVDNVIRLSTAEEILQLVRPTASLTEVRARVLAVREETSDTGTWLLQPNALWRGYQAGQHVAVRTVRDGRRVQRPYSLSSAPGVGPLAITVKRQPGGLVSNHMHDTLHVGDIVTLGAAEGDFVLPAVPPARLILLSAGSGITPVMSLLRMLRKLRHAGAVDFVHVCRSPDDLIFGNELRGLAVGCPELPGLRVHLHFSANAGRWTPADLSPAVPDWAERPTWLCGPSAFMDTVATHWTAQGAQGPLHRERFTPAWTPPQPLDAPVTVQAQRAGRRFASTGASSLLLQAEQAGLMPKHGCRIGICRSCQCIKRSGTVQNLQTGALSREPNELIRLCVSAARSDLTLDL